MAVELTALDPYADYLRVTLREVTPAKAVVEQPADPEVDNHVKVRHASALYTAAYEAARQLVLAALGERAASAELKVVDSEIAYKAVGLGTLTTTAEPQGPGWDALAADLDAGGRPEVEVSVLTTDPAGKVVVTLGARFAVTA